MSKKIEIEKDFLFPNFKPKQPTISKSEIVANKINHKIRTVLFLQDKIKRIQKHNIKMLNSNNLKPKKIQWLARRSKHVEDITKKCNKILRQIKKIFNMSLEKTKTQKTLQEKDPFPIRHPILPELEKLKRINSDY